MANKREFKKYVNTVCDNIISEMTYASYVNEGADVQAIDDAVVEVLRAGGDALLKSNVKYDKSARAFDNEHDYHVARDRFFHEMFRKINKEFVAAIEGALKKFNSALPAEVKAAQKANA